MIKEGVPALPVDSYRGGALTVTKSVEGVRREEGQYWHKRSVLNQRVNSSQILSGTSIRIVINGRRTVGSD